MSMKIKCVIAFLVLILAMPTHGMSKEVILSSISSHPLLSQRSLNQRNVTYVIMSNFDLQGKQILVPSGCKIKFSRGSISNGVLVGQETLLDSDEPFLGSDIYVKGCITSKEINRDTEIFITVRHNQQEIQNLINLSRPNVKTIVSKGTFRDVDTILLTSDIDIDFSNSVLMSRIDINKCSSPFFFMEPWVDSKIITIAIRNVYLDGKIPSYDVRDQVGGNGERRRAIQIFNVDNVLLDNVNLSNFWYGTEGKFSKDLKKRFELSEVAIMNSIKCTIRNCSLTAGRGDGFKVVPKNSNDNYTEFVGNHIYKYYGSSFEIVDGKCLIRDNIIEDFNGSALNAFCYDSEICNNIFKNGQRSCGIDLTEGEYYYADNVIIHDNIQYGGKEGFCEICGQGIIVQNNTYNGGGTFCRVLHGYITDKALFDNIRTYSITDKVGIIISSNYASGVNYGVETNYNNIDINIYNIEITDNTFTLKDDLTNENEKGNSILLRGVHNIRICTNNFNNCLGSIMSPKSSNWITLFNCAGILKIEDNTFTHNEKLVYYPTNAFVTTGAKNSFSEISFKKNKSTVKRSAPRVNALILQSGRKWTVNVNENSGVR